MHLIFDDDVIVGRINLSNIDRDGVASADVGYRISKDYAGRGVTTQALKIVEVMTLNAYGLNILNGSCLETNPASIAFLRKTVIRKPLNAAKLSGKEKP